MVDSRLRGAGEARPMECDQITRMLDYRTGDPMEPARQAL